MTCARCQRPISPRLARGGKRFPDRLGHYGRGLCAMCYEHARLEGTLADYETRSMRACDVLAEWELHADPTKSRKSQIEALAPRMGMSVKALEKALERATKRERSAA